MTKKTKIEWCDDTVNPTGGCDGCWLWKHADIKIRKCYAGQLVGRWGGLDKDGTRRKGWTDRFDHVMTFPGRMLDAAKEADLYAKERPNKPWLNGLPRIIFIGDMSDIFSGAISFEYLRDEVIGQITSEKGKRHYWQILTKRPQRLAEFTRWLADQGIPFPENAWIGTSISKQIHCGSIKHLIKAGNPDTIRFISLEPQFERVDLREWLPNLDWIIQGGESGKSAEPFDPDWAREMRDHCREFGVAYFLKQLGTTNVKGGGKGNHWEDWAEDLRVRQMPIKPIPVAEQKPVAVKSSLKRALDASSVEQLSLSHIAQAEKVRKTDAEYLSDLDNQLRIIKDRVRGVVHRQATGLYLCGRAGTSKTHTVRTTLESVEVPYHYSSGHLTPIGLFDLLSENRDKVIVLDDVSSIFNQPIALQLLLAALGQPHKENGSRRISYKTARGDMTVHFSGGIIAISNLPLNGHHNEVLQALRDRVYAISFDPSDEQLIALFRDIASRGVRGVPPVDCSSVIEFLIESMGKTSIRPTMRLFHKALRDFELHQGGKCEAHWKDLILSNLREEVLIPEQPLMDVSRAEQSDAERRIAAELGSIGNRKDRLKAWSDRTGKSQAAFYRRFKEAKSQGLV